jgi:hypothetical protein
MSHPLVVQRQITRKFTTSHPKRETPRYILRDVLYRLSYPLQAQPGGVWHVLSSEMQLSPHGLLFAGLQCLQHPPAGGLVGGMTIGGFVGRMIAVGFNVRVGSGRVATSFVFVAVGLEVLVNVGVRVQVAVGSRVDVAGIGVNVASSVGVNVGSLVAVGNSIVMSTRLGCSCVGVGV